MDNPNRDPNVGGQPHENEPQPDNQQQRDDQPQEETPKPDWNREQTQGSDADQEDLGEEGPQGQ